MPGAAGVIRGENTGALTQAEGCDREDAKKVFKRRKRGQFRDGSLERGRLSEWPRLLGMCPTLVQFGH